MSRDAISLLQSVVRDQLKGFKTAELGVVTAVYSHEAAADKNNYECDVRLRDSGLELKRLPVATQRVGAVAIPNPDDLVLVQYLNGDVHSAVITGRLYNDADRPPEAKPRELVYVSPDAAEQGVRRLHLELPNGNTLTLDDDRLVVEMGKTRLTLDHDGAVALEASGKVTVDAQGDTTVSVQGNLELGASGDVSVSGTNVSLEAKANATLKAGAGATVQGTLVKLAGKTDFTPA